MLRGVRVSTTKSLTRGNGILESLLARMRANQADRLIPDTLRRGRILDIGCGSYPYFLSHTSFKEKFALDKLTPVSSSADIRLYNLDVNDEHDLPFDEGFFTVITMLAVVEHLNPCGLASLFREVYRLLQPGGIIIVTTPAAWSSNLLRWMARAQLVSAEEIEEHTFVYTPPILGWYFGQAGFAMDKVRFGRFEFMFNTWATAER